MQYKLADYVLTNFLFFFQALKFVVGVVGMVERLMVFSSREFYLEDLQIKMVTFFNSKCQIKFWFTVDIMFILFEQSISLSPSTFKE